MEEMGLAEVVKEEVEDMAQKVMEEMGVTEKERNLNIIIIFVNNKNAY